MQQYGEAHMATTPLPVQGARLRAGRARRDSAWGC